MHIFLIVLFAVTWWVGPLVAKDFPLPPEKPVATLAITDDWHPEETPRGVRAQTKDAEMNLTVAATADAKEMASIIDEADARLKARKVTLDRSSRQDRKFKLKGFPAEELVYQGRDNAGPVVVVFTFVTIRDAALVFTCWSTREGDQNHQTELGVMFDSLRAVTLPVGTPTVAPKPKL